MAFIALLVLAIFALKVHFGTCDYQIPELKLKAYTPSGLEASIPDYPEVQLFAFHAKINEKLCNGEPGDYTGDITQAKNGKWTFWDPNIKLEIGDTVCYWVFVLQDKLGFEKESKWKVEKLLPRAACKSSSTLLNGENVCARDVIFEEQFNGNTIDVNKWTIEHRIPNLISGPDFEFVSYQNDKEICYIKNDILYVKPKIESVRQVLDLTNGCTSSFQKECYFKKQSYLIPPPVASANIYSRSTFQYGIFEIKAKLPAGDWIYPKVYLKHLGQMFFKIFIAYARGNDKLIRENKGDLGSRLLFAGPVKSPAESQKSKFLRSIKSDTPYTNQMHVYKLIWEPDKMTFFVDNVEFGTIDTSFDKPVVINLGLGVGGINDFPDGFISNIDQEEKPWVNGDPKQMKKFYYAKNTWAETWKGDESALQVDYVKVWAI